MAYIIDESEIKSAKNAHELFMIGLGGLLLLGPLSIFLGIGRIALLIPILYSSGFALYTWRRLLKPASWFIEMHWRLALGNYRWLFIGFAISAVMLLLSWFVESSADPNSPSQFLAMALVRIGVMPSIIMVFACFVMENGALNQVLRHDVPRRLVENHPPPENIQRSGE